MGVLTSVNGLISTSGYEQKFSKPMHCGMFCMLGLVLDVGACSDVLN